MICSALFLENKEPYVLHGNTLGGEDTDWVDWAVVDAPVEHWLERQPG